MKCIRCDTDNTLQDRTSNYGRCKNCQHPFVFEPTSMGTVKVTDPMFDKAINDLSANNTLFFTPKQLYYFLDHRLRKKGGISTASWVIPYIFFVAFTIMIGLGATTASGLPFVHFIPPIAVSVLFILATYTASQSDKVDFLQRKTSARGLQLIGAITIIWGIILCLIRPSYFGLLITTLLGVLTLYLGKRQTSRTERSQTFLFEQSQFQEWLTRWQQINDSMTKLLPPPREQKTVATVNSDVTAYSFDRLVVCDRTAIAQLLIANNFHFENNCAILSITGYPQSIFNITMEMLRRNPDLKVYALHDCTPRGLGLMHQLRTSPNWFPDSSIAIVDIGLSPRQILANPGMFIQTSTESATVGKQMPPEVRQSLSTQEITWLEAGNYVELESFTPQRLIQVLNRGIAGSQNFGSDNDGGIIFVGDSGGYFATDSFG